MILPRGGYRSQAAKAGRTSGKPVSAVKLGRSPGERVPGRDGGSRAAKLESAPRRRLAGCAEVSYIMKIGSSWLDRALAGLLPELCQGCGGPADAGFCVVCLALIRGVGDACPDCGLERPVARCPRPDRGWRIASVTAPFRYESTLDRHIQTMKFRPSRPMGRALGLLLVQSLENRGLIGDVDALVPVPLHRRRLVERGFNQAFEIARPVAAASGLPLLIRGVHRRANTRPQSLLAAHERYRNLRGAFTVRRNLKDLNVAIVDDVITTGATANALAASLRDAGAGEVRAWALARVAPRDGPLR